MGANSTEIQFLMTNGMTQRVWQTGDTLIDAATIRNALLPVVSRTFKVTPAIKAANDICLATAGTAAKAMVIEAGAAAKLLACPRNIRTICASSWDGGDFLVVGTNQFDEYQTETIAGVATQTTVGAKVWKTIVSITRTVIGINGATATVGTGDTIGVPMKLANDCGILVADTAGTPVLAVATVSATYSAYATSVAPDGTKVFQFIGNV